MNYSIFALQVLIMLMPVFLALYLSYIKITNKVIANDYKSGTREHRLHTILYSYRFLRISVLLAFLAIIDFANRFFITPSNRNLGLLVFFVFQMIGGLIVLVMIYHLYSDSKNKKT